MLKTAAVSFSFLAELTFETLLDAARQRTANRSWIACQKCRAAYLTRFCGAPNARLFRLRMKLPKNSHLAIEATELRALTC